MDEPVSAPGWTDRILSVLDLGADLHGGLLMPRAALVPCGYPGCAELVERGRCARHAINDVPTSEDRKARQRLYGRSAWQRARRAQLAGEPWCADCLRANIYTPATDVHHVHAHGGDPVAFATSPLESLCHACHTRRTDAEIRSRGRGGGKVYEKYSQSGAGLPREKMLRNGESGNETC